jgi:alkanesulfonate monooxygenase SsuD/methylene tetrahydromethanopterin reductase-like flavin-dependent oxidoreductase (luciferase family)
VLVGLLSEPEFSFQGRYYQLTGALNEPKGPQRPHPPICIGGGGEKRTLRTTARFAQHWNFGGGTTEEFARKRDVLRAHCADLGRDPSEITLSSHVQFDPAAGASATADQVAALGAAGLDLAIVYLRPPLDPAVLEPLAAAFAQID